MCLWLKEKNVIKKSILQTYSTTALMRAEGKETAKLANMLFWKKILQLGESYECIHVERTGVKLIQNKQDR